VPMNQKVALRSSVVGPAENERLLRLVSRLVDGGPDGDDHLQSRADTRAPAILLVEDNLGDARLVREMLRDAFPDGFEFVHAELLAEARELVQIGPGERRCILLDLTLPDGQGLDSVRCMREAAPNAAIVVLTGLDDERLGEDAVKNGAQDYLVKGRADSEVLSRSIRYSVERKRTEEELLHQAHHDIVTGLPNRVLFLDRLGCALARGQRRGSGVAVLFLDLDGFKILNDSLGHEAGDQLLASVAQRISLALRPADTIARFGGDEFVILCEDLRDESDATTIAERVIASMDASHSVRDSEVFVTTSVGVAFTASGATAAEDLVRDADAAMFRAKDRGKNRCEVFRAPMHRRALDRLETDRALHHALSRRELFVVYQPEIRISDWTVLGAEALVRWDRPGRGVVAPHEFIGVAEETGLIDAIGDFVLHEACAQAVTWRRQTAGAEAAVVRVNVSAVQLTRGGFTSRVVDALAAAALEPDGLCLEITESAVMRDLEASHRVLSELQAIGIRLSIDDFGTGHSSLSRLHTLPVQSLKIDQSFVAAAGPGEDITILSAIVQVAHALGLQAVAEGVETADQLAVLTSIGCDSVQGFYLGTPQLGPDLLRVVGRRLPCRVVSERGGWPD
jgi:diguanylate cyclase (GGDEF)-like protein